jgi:hypothetical protein
MWEQSQIFATSHRSIHRPRGKSGRTQKNLERWNRQKSLSYAGNEMQLMLWDVRLRQRIAVEMRKCGYNWVEIAAALEYASKDSARQAVYNHRQKVLAQYQRLDTAYRTNHLLEVANLKANLIEALEQNPTDAALYGAYVKLIEREAKLTGADVPQAHTLEIKPVNEMNKYELYQELDRIKLLEQRIKDGDITDVEGGP